MNRTTVLILALVLLLAHVLAMHHDSAGAFALPSDLAHVDFRIARNAIHGQGTTWTAGATAAAIAEEGGTSLLWVMIAAGAELVSVSPVRTSAVVGILAALLTMACMARLSRDRLIGVTATVLLVCSGPFAACAADGTETTLYALLLSLAFLAQERGRSRVLGVSLALAVLTRSDAIIMVAGLLIIALLRRRSERGHIRLTVAFVPPVAAFAALVGIRVLHNASPITAQLAAIFAFDPVQIKVGLWSLEALVRGTVAPLLLLLPLAQLPFGGLSGTGRRALGLTCLGTAAVVLSGASASPMHAAFVPLLPLAFIAVQEAFIEGLERRPKLEWAVWSSLALACLASTLASKMPGNIGPLPTAGMLRAMARENPVRKEAFGNEWNGRLGVADELLAAERLRAVGIFFRDQVTPDATVLSPWPGAIGYLSRLRVTDLLGRTQAAAGESTAAWTGRRRTDVVAALQTLPDYIVPMIAGRLRPPTQVELITRWLERFDTLGNTPERRSAMVAALEPYELVAVPTPARESDLLAPASAPAFLLRRLDLKLSPILNVVQKDGQLEIRLRHPGHHQIAELEVRATTADGRARFLRPTGDFESETPVRARTEILLFPTGDRRINLITAKMPESLAGAQLRVRLVNPFSDADDPLAGIGSAIELTVDPAQ